MINTFITGIIIAYVVQYLIRKQKRDSQGQQSYQQPPQQNYQRAPQQNYQRPPQQNYQRPPQQSYQRAPQQANGRYSRMPNPKQNTGRPAQPVQGTRSAAPKEDPVRPDDILSRANANVRENEADELLRAETGMLVTDEPSELIRQVNDLMITGYQANLSFERDFIAEGVELLGRYEISAEL